MNGFKQCSLVDGYVCNNGDHKGYLSLSECAVQCSGAAGGMFTYNMKPTGGTDSCYCVRDYACGLDFRGDQSAVYAKDGVSAHKVF